MRLIVGLGNPGAKYTFHRHNVGFVAIDAALMSLDLTAQFKSEHKSLTQKLQVEGESVLFAKPQTFMNLSGEAVLGLLTFYNLNATTDLLVIQDDIDQEFGALKIQTGRGHGGHNGIRNLHEKIGTDYARLKIGVGRPANPDQEVASYVLQNFSDSEAQSLRNSGLEMICDAIFYWISNGTAKTANQYNSVRFANNPL